MSKFSEIKAEVSTIPGVPVLPMDEVKDIEINDCLIYSNIPFRRIKKSLKFAQYVEFRQKLFINKSINELKSSHIYMSSIDKDARCYLSNQLKKNRTYKLLVIYKGSQKAKWIKSVTDRCVGAIVCSYKKYKEVTGLNEQEFLETLESESDELVKPSFWDKFSCMGCSQKKDE
jgi:hypothetical protein